MLLVPMGITFAAARVYAEGGMGPPPCDAGTVSACNGGAPLERCSTCVGSVEDCVCASAVCDGNQPALVCMVATHCEKSPNHRSCDGKTAGEACTSDVGSGPARCVLVPASCYLPDGGAGWAAIDRLRCEPGTPTSSSSSSSSSSTSSSSSSSSSSGGTPEAGPPSWTNASTSSSSGGSGAPATDDSGCSASPRAASSVLALIGAPLAIGLLLARRRRGQAPPRKAPSARKRS
ncbi:MAG: hypothetical protein KIT84_22570 [Labilithrix sp.]|nr:hypothetical protein [Labilithrix sp.]